MTERIIVRISPKGETSIKVTGVAGPGCTDLTANLEHALGKTKSDETTPDFDLTEGTLTDDNMLDA